MTSSNRVLAEENAHSRGLTAIQRAYRSATANRISIERYQLWHQVDSQFGFPFVTHYSLTALLFPAGKSDRLYVLLLSSWWPSPSKPADEFLCFQQKGDKVRLLYTLHLQQRDQLLRKKTRVSNLIEYVHYMGWAIKGKMNKEANHDLTATTDYASYEYYTIIDTLGVSLLSDLNGGQYHVPYGDKEQYDIRKDPLTGKAIAEGSDGFYRKYGLPVAGGELFSIMHRNKHD